MALLLVFAGCKKDPSVWEIRNLNGDNISAIGHGGMGVHSKYPMNSYESLSNCLSLGADGVEMDVCVTKDSVMVLCHSQKLQDQTGCEGLIKDRTYAEIKDCRFNTPLLSKASLIPASYFFDRIENKGGLTFTFDCKLEVEDNFEYLSLFADALLRHLQKYNITANSCIESFNTYFLEILHSRNKDLHLFLYTQNYQTGLAISKEISLYGLTLDQKNISAAEIEEAHKNNLRIALFNTLTERDNLDAIAKSPDYIQSDRLDHLIHALKE